jgi:AraC-like DNA-binding protein
MKAKPVQTSVAGRFADRLGEAMAANPEGRVCVVNSRIRPRRAPHANRMVTPRLIVGLEGVRYHTVVIAGREQEIALRRGDVLFVAAEAWMSLYYLEDADVLHTNIHPRSLVCKLAEYRAPAGPLQKNYDFEARERCVIAQPPGKHADLLARMLGDPLPAAAGSDCRRHLLMAMVDLLHGCLSDADTTEPRGKAWATWETIRSYVEENLSRDLSRASVARQLGLHPNHVSRIFKQYAGCSFSQYLNQHRIDSAKALLAAHSELNVSQVSHAAGYNSPAHFCRLFRAQVGSTPSEYRLAALRGRNDE